MKILLLLTLKYHAAAPAETFAPGTHTATVAVPLSTTEWQLAGAHFKLLGAGPGRAAAPGPGQGAVPLTEPQLECHSDWGGGGWGGESESLPRSLSPSGTVTDSLAFKVDSEFRRRRRTGTEWAPVRPCQWPGTAESKKVRRPGKTQTAARYS